MEENPLKNVETFWQFHSYLAKIWDAIKERNGGKQSARNPFNYNYLRSPFASFFDKTLGNDPDQAIFADLLRADFFVEINQYQHALSFSWERSGYIQSEDLFTEKIKVFHEFFENAANQVWEALVKKYELPPKEMLARLLPVFTLLSNEVLIISETCLKMGISGLPYYEYYTVFNELLLKMQQLFKLAEVDEDILFSVLELKNQLIIYAVIFGFPYFRGHESQAWCPEELIAVIEEENTIVTQEVRLLENLVDQSQVKKVTEWYHRNKTTPATIPDIPEDVPLTDAVIHYNLSIISQFYEMLHLGQSAQKFQERFQLSEYQAILALYRQLLPAEFQKVVSAKKTKGKPKPVSAPPAKAEIMPKQEEVLEGRLASFSKKLDGLEKGLSTATLLDPPSMPEIEFILEVIQSPLAKPKEEEEDN
ncbi:MAG TPA: hypothetical protein VKK79_02830 [Candidatus Lokiarchaeia archaeon]|nr:hypothetical protein [Candidatus Lokiarchaeia archaeon]